MRKHRQVSHLENDLYWKLIRQFMDLETVPFDRQEEALRAHDAVKQCLLSGWG